MNTLQVPQYIQILKTATRVLMAIAERRQPADEDIAELRLFVPAYADEELDILACQVVQHAMLKRREDRDSSFSEK